MAEAAVQNPPCCRRFYCHQCSTEVTPNLTDYTCSRCNSGFIEEVTVVSSSPNGSNSNSPQDSSTQQDPVTELWAQALFGHDPLGMSGMRRSRDQTESTEILPGPSGSRTVRVVRAPNRNPYLEGLINYFLTRLGGEQVQGIPINMFQLHGNPGDYAWGAGGLDTIITQLLNQLESCGPPPAELDKIEALPTVTIGDEHTARDLQCSICMEDFQLGDKTKCLPCEHHYHPDCIIPWLKLHGTCPVCRKDLNGQDTTAKEDNLLSSMDPFGPRGGGGSSSQDPPSAGPSNRNTFDPSPSLD